VSCSFDFRSPLRFGDEIEVRIGIARISRRSVTYRAEIVCTDAIVAVGHSTSACCEIRDGGDVSPVDIPQEMREKLSAFVIEEEVA
jgi:acyl-CoA thioesterase FadM